MNDTAVDARLHFAATAFLSDNRQLLFDAETLGRAAARITGGNISSAIELFASLETFLAAAAVEMRNRESPGALLDMLSAKRQSGATST